MSLTREAIFLGFLALILNAFRTWLATLRYRNEPLNSFRVSMLSSQRLPIYNEVGDLINLTLAKDAPNSFYVAGYVNHYAVIYNKQLLFETDFLIAADYFLMSPSVHCAGFRDRTR